MANEDSPWRYRDWEVRKADRTEVLQKRLSRVPFFLKRPVMCSLTSEVRCMGQRKAILTALGVEAKKTFVELLRSPGNTRVQSRFKSWFHHGLGDLESYLVAS